MHTYAIPIILLCFIASTICVNQMHIHLKGKEKKGLKSLFPLVFAEYLATTLEEKGKPGNWLIAFILFAFVFIFLVFAQLLWVINPA